jgi:hypothetical protein
LIRLEISLKFNAFYLRSSEHFLLHILIIKSRDYIEPLFLNLNYAHYRGLHLEEKEGEGEEEGEGKEEEEEREMGSSNSYNTRQNIYYSVHCFMFHLNDLHVYLSCSNVKS